MQVKINCFDVEGAFWNLYIFLNSFPAAGQNYYYCILPLFSLESPLLQNCDLSYFMSFVLISDAYFQLKDLPFL